MKMSHFAAEMCL